MTDFAATRARFRLPPGVVYLDGNSLGPLPVGAAERAARTLEREWGGELIRAWNTAGWMDMPRRVGDRIAALIGAPKGCVAVGDTLSIKVFQALSAALDLTPGRRVILSDSGNFPSDLYVADGLAALRGAGHDVRVVAPEAVDAAIGGDVAALMLTHVDYRSGRMHDMAALTRKAHAHGVPVVWDLAHSAGATTLDLAGAGADFAVGCTYKYLNGGPGAPAFVYARPDRIEGVRPALAGWLGHAAPFAFERGFRPAPGVERLRVGTPPVIQMAVLEVALEAFEGVDLDALRARSMQLTQMFVEAVERRCPEVALASPRDPVTRGSQVSLRFAEGYAAMQALIAEGVIGDYRAPDLMRFGFAPLYNDESDVEAAVATLERVLKGRLWDRPQFLARAAVT